MNNLRLTSLPQHRPTDTEPSRHRHGGRVHAAAVRRVGLRALLVAGALASAGAVYAQTTFYSYDAVGRLRSTGTGANDSRTYSLDGADNRRYRTSGAAVGWSIRPDGFDEYYYLLRYPDLRTAGIDPYAHWLYYGAYENREPNRFFDPVYYRNTYNVPANVDPLNDYHTTGWRLGRNPSAEFSTSLYLQAHPDVAAANINPLWHYLSWGFAEGRARFPA